MLEDSPRCGRDIIFFTIISATHLKTLTVPQAVNLTRSSTFTIQQVVSRHALKRINLTYYFNPWVPA